MSEPAAVPLHSRRLQQQHLHDVMQAAQVAITDTGRLVAGTPGCFLSRLSFEEAFRLNISPDPASCKSRILHRLRVKPAVLRAQNPRYASAIAQYNLNGTQPRIDQRR